MLRHHLRPIRKCIVTKEELQFLHKLALHKKLILHENETADPFLRELLRKGLVLIHNDLGYEYITLSDTGRNALIAA